MLLAGNNPFTHDAEEQLVAHVTGVAYRRPPAPPPAPAPGNSPGGAPVINVEGVFSPRVPESFIPYTPPLPLPSPSTVPSLHEAHPTAPTTLNAHPPLLQSVGTGSNHPARYATLIGGSPSSGNLPGPPLPLVPAPSLPALGNWQLTAVETPVTLAMPSLPSLSVENPSAARPSPRINYDAIMSMLPQEDQHWDQLTEALQASVVQDLLLVHSEPHGHPTAMPLTASPTITESVLPPPSLNPFTNRPPNGPSGLSEAPSEQELPSTPSTGVTISPATSGLLHHLAMPGIEPNHAHGSVSSIITPPSIAGRFADRVGDAGGSLPVPAPAVVPAPALASASTPALASTEAQPWDTYESDLAMAIALSLQETDEPLPPLPARPQEPEQAIPGGSSPVSSTLVPSIENLSLAPSTSEPQTSGPSPSVSTSSFAHIIPEDDGPINDEPPPPYSEPDPNSVADIFTPHYSNTGGADPRHSRPSAPPALPNRPSQPQVPFSRPPGVPASLPPRHHLSAPPHLPSRPVSYSRPAGPPPGRQGAPLPPRPSNAYPGTGTATYRTASSAQASGQPPPVRRVPPW